MLFVLQRLWVYSLHELRRFLAHYRTSSLTLIIKLKIKDFSFLISAHTTVSGISFLSTSHLTWIIDKDKTGYPTNNV